jgi:ABC-type multidrug transport system ATPase subunit
MLTGLVLPTSGNALVAGHDVLRDLRALSNLVGVCPQQDILWPELTVREHLLFYARVKGVPRAVESAAVAASAANVGLLGAGVHKLHAAVRRLSSGERRRLSLAIALLGSPAVVFLDEPTSGLDPESRRLVWQVIESARAGRAILLATHAMEEADQLCSRLGILANGALRALGSNVHLKNKWGAGYKVDITFMPRAEAALDVFIRAILPTAELDMRRSWLGIRMYRVRRQDVSLTRLFHRMDHRDEATGIIHWGVRQTSLEEIFLLVTADFELAVDGSQQVVRFDGRARRAAGRVLQRVNSVGRRALVAAGAAMGDTAVVGAGAPAEAAAVVAPPAAPAARAPRAWAARLPMAVACLRPDDDDGEPAAADFEPNLDPWPDAAAAVAAREPPADDDRQLSLGAHAFRRFFFHTELRQRPPAAGGDDAPAPERGGGGRRRRDDGGGSSRV